VHMNRYLAEGLGLLAALALAAALFALGARG
jgi:hypothetical protein